MEISKELLSNIIGKHTKDFVIEKNELRYILEDDKNSIPELYYINIYELENKGKKWASNKGFRIIEIDTDLFWVIPKKYNISYSFNYEMISSTHNTFFKACQWILDNKEG